MSEISLASELQPFSHALGGYWLEAGLLGDGRASCTIHLIIQGYMPRSEIIAMQMNCAASVKRQLYAAMKRRRGMDAITEDEFIVNSVVHYA